MVLEVDPHYCELDGLGVFFEGLDHWRKHCALLGVDLSFRAFVEHL